ncbi:hypothetical protein LXM60_13995 [Pandoraea sputorum]|uniref:hypothetical protein n=1 Tax=Pandoraea sputorum TaxID=93222 RepID=UPI001E3F9608|nr:hypothetical protein [Pandoraea sputorum]MCE4061317.1 hypothetical protein [Pandoraea sputorum]
MDNQISSTPLSPGALQNAALTNESENTHPASGQMGSDLNAVGHSPAGSMAQERGGSTTVRLRSALVGVRAEDIEQTDRSEVIESVKHEMKFAIRLGVEKHRSVVVPESFMNLTERSKQEVARLTVSWIFDPVDEESQRRFECLVSDVRIQPYLKNTLPQGTYDEILQLSSDHLNDEIARYEMVEGEEEGEVDVTERVETAKVELWGAVRNGVARKPYVRTPESFALLSPQHKQDVVRYAVHQLLSVDWRGFESHFKYLTQIEDVKPHLKGTLTKSDYAAIQRKLAHCDRHEKSYVESYISAKRMLAED